MFDLTGKLPSPSEVTLFGLNPDSDKRAKMIDGILDSDAYARYWAGYWRDVIFYRATEQRAKLMQPVFVAWMTEQLKQNVSWDKIATEMLTATGDVKENGATAMIFAQMGQAEEVAAEASRIFLGIQIQCANCHDHPSDKWKRKQFHELAAFFPRVRVRAKRDGAKRTFEVVSFAGKPVEDRMAFLKKPQPLIRRLDKNGDHFLSQAEVKGTPAARIFNQLLKQGDKNNDKLLSAAEIMKIELPENARKQTSEHYMSDLKNPSSMGTRTDPAFFVNGKHLKQGLDDLDRRTELAKLITSHDNVWFARAFVNRMWAEMVGQGFYMPLDDMGPERTAAHPEVLELLADDFTANNYDVKRLVRTIANTTAYQRQIRDVDPAQPAGRFASTTATRLRSDQLFSAILAALQYSDDPPADTEDELKRPARFRGPRAHFDELFGFDPSTPRDDVIGTVPQALFLMNSPFLNRLITGRGNSSLARILKEHPSDDDAVNELYLLVLAREATDGERKTCNDYIKDVGNRPEAYEDLMWSLFNSTEFLSKR